MDDVARLPVADRTDLFVATASRRALSPAIIEKDFWVCWTLKRIFTLPDPPAGLLFKGGTSLSKVFGVIERFSEDVDLSFDRAGLGFGGESDPLNATTGKKRKHGLEALTETCQRAIREQFLPQLMTAFGDALGEPPSATWGLDLDEDDPDGQTLLFRYPAENRSHPADEPAYVRPVVRLEIGARSDHWPVLKARTRNAQLTRPAVWVSSAITPRRSTRDNGALASGRCFRNSLVSLHHSLCPACVPARGRAGKPQRMDRTSPARTCGNLRRVCRRVLGDG